MTTWTKTADGGLCIEDAVLGHRFDIRQIEAGFEVACGGSVATTVVTQADAMLFVLDALSSPVDLRKRVAA